MKSNSVLFNVIGKNSLVLMCFTLICIVILAAVNYWTTPQIQAAKQAKELKSLIEILDLEPDQTSDLQSVCRQIELTLNDQSNLSVKLYQIESDQRLFHLVHTTTMNGYNGRIKLAIGLDKSQIIGVRVLEHRETPGLGDKIEIEKSDWITHFKGIQLNNKTNWQVKKYNGDFDSFTGATITPQAVSVAIGKVVTNIEDIIVNSEKAPLCN